MESHQNIKQFNSTESIYEHWHKLSISPHFYSLLIVFIWIATPPTTLQTTMATILTVTLWRICHLYSVSWMKNTWKTAFSFSYWLFVSQTLHAYLFNWNIQKKNYFICVTKRVSYLLCVCVLFLQSKRDRGKRTVK